MYHFLKQCLLLEIMYLITCSVTVTQLLTLLMIHIQHTLSDTEGDNIQLLLVEAISLHEILSYYSNQREDMEE